MYGNTLKSHDIKPFFLLPTHKQALEREFKNLFPRHVPILSAEATQNTSTVKTSCMTFFLM